jgi:hypothetical protein
MKKTKKQCKYGRRLSSGKCPTKKVLPKPALVKKVAKKPALVKKVAKKPALVEKVPPNPDRLLKNKTLIQLILANKDTDAIALIDKNKYVVNEYDNRGKDALYYTIIYNRSLIKKHILKARNDIYREQYKEKIEKAKNRQIAKIEPPKLSSFKPTKNKLDGYDPFLNEHVNTNAWLKQDAKHFILTYNDLNLCLSTDYFSNISLENIIIECKIDNNNLLFQETLKSPNLIRLQRYGIGRPCVCSEERFKTLISTKRQIKLTDTPYKITGVDKEFVVQNPNAYSDVKSQFGVEYIHEVPLRVYTTKHYKQINNYLRNGEKLDNKNQHMNSFVELIDDAFNSALKTQEITEVYRGTDGEFPEGLQLSYLSTSTVDYVAKQFIGFNSCCFCILLLDVGIPYIWLSDISEFSGEDEILLPRNLVLKLIDTKVPEYGFSIKFYKVSLDDPTRYSDSGVCREYQLLDFE